MISEDDLNYSTEGQTHGALSHALKHMKDIFATVPDIGSKINAFAGSFRSTVEDHIKSGGKVWHSDGGEPTLIEDDETFSQIMDKIFLYKTKLIF